MTKIETAISKGYAVIL